MKAAQENDKIRALANNALVQAFAFSVMLHIVAVLAVEIGRGMGWWEQSLLPAKVQQLIEREKELDLEKMVQLPKMENPVDMPLLFIEVDPAESVEQAPKEAKYYSTANTLAANPTPKNEPVPKIDGRQENVPKILEVMKPEAPKPAPELPPKEQPKSQKTPEPVKPTPPKPVQPEPEPEPPKKILPNDGDIQVAKAPKPAEPQPKPEPPKPKPRTVADAKKQKGIIEGPKMKQEGGVRKHTIGISENAKKSPFGSYDHAFIAAVQARWYTLLDERDVVRGQVGKVVLDFRLNKDGRITDMKVVETEVGDLLAWVCQRAILDPSPYRPFPADLLAEMRRTTRREHRDVRFTFFYNR